MKRHSRMLYSFFLGTVSASIGLACGEEDTGSAVVSIQNDFNDPEIEKKPPWTICKAFYLDAEFENIGIGETSEEQEVIPGLDHVLMVAAWDDPECSPEHCLPIASKNEEEVVDGQTRTIVINVPNHQGPCPPEGVAPMPQELYDRILELWPEYDFKSYDERTENPQCQD